MWMWWYQSVSFPASSLALDLPREGRLARLGGLLGETIQSILPNEYSEASPRLVRPCKFSTHFSWLPSSPWNTWPICISYIFIIGICRVVTMPISGKKIRKRKAFICETKTGETNSWTCHRRCIRVCRCRRTSLACSCRRRWRGSRADRAHIRPRRDSRRRPTPTASSVHWMAESLLAATHKCRSTERWNRPVYIGRSAGCAPNPLTNTDQN